MLKKEFPNTMKSIPKGLDGLLTTGVPSWSVIEPFVPMDTTWLLEEGGANGVTAAPEAGAPSAAGALVKPAANPVPGL